nr:hypothetical protein [Desulfobacula sp.]
MDAFIKGGLVLLAGIALGTAGTLIITRRDESLRDTVVGAVAQGMKAKEKVLTSLEKARENVEDLVAEARYAGKSQKPSAPDETESPA